MSESKRNVPKLRFPGFTEAWEQRKFDDVFVGLSSNSLSRADLNTETGLIQSVHYGDVLIKYGECLDAQCDQISYVSDDGIAHKLSSNRLELGDVIIADAAEDETVGKCTELVKLGTNPIVSGLHTIPVRPRISFALGYLGYYLNAGVYHNQLLPLMQGTKISSVSKTALDTTIVRFPSMVEQSILVDLFDRISDLITLHQRKLDHLKLQKRGLLQKMFPRDGADRPEIRFPGFTDAWEQRKLGEVASEFQSGEFIAANEIVETGAYPVYGGNGLRGYTNRYNHEGFFVLIGRQGALCGNIKSADGKAYFTEHAVVVKANSEHDTRFLVYLLGRMNLGQYSGQSAQPGLAVGVLKELDSAFPLKAEQARIGSFFRDLDDLITLHQRKLDHLKLQKKALLQQMFI